ncbi:TIGR03013 family XrtA/PEP-CTERM system glycosyltransferase [Thermodesulfobacteriota bacterium]
MLVWRFFYMLVLSHGIFNQKIILLGSGELAQKIEAEVHEKKDSGYTISVKVQKNRDITDRDIKADPLCIIKRDYDGLCEAANELNIRKIVVAISEKRGAFPIRELLKCRVDGIDILEGNSFYEMLTGKLIVEQINPAWLIFSEGFRKSLFRRFVKRTEDLILSFIMLVFLMPLVILIGLLIKMDSKGPVFFSQERVGEDRKPYRVYKFRSMITDAEKLSGPVWAKGDDERVTRVGERIRKLRIDEIPQLWNVLKGDMSFVGPRPEREFFVKQLEEIIPYYGERFTVKPGLTGWAQVSYGYGASVEDAIEKLNYDLFYIKNMSTFRDLMIVFRTVKIVLFGKGAR